MNRNSPTYAMSPAHFLTLAILLSATTNPAYAADLTLMPRVEDYTHMGWAEGFPGHTPGAPWRRVVQTGYYAMVSDTETLRIPHFGPVPGGVSYSAAARADNRLWQSLPPAELVLTVTTGGKTYRCTGGGPWSRFKRPRLVESGRFLQRADVTDLVFTAEDGARLNVESRLETVAWPDRLALILAARPGVVPIPAGETCFGRVGGGDFFRLFDTGGLGYVPITFAGLTSPRGYVLLLDNQPVNQAVHGNDFWQTDYEPATQRWSRTYNIPVSNDVPHIIRLEGRH